jgi:predicted RND superfamily exporter protein
VRGALSRLLDALFTHRLLVVVGVLVVTAGLLVVALRLEFTTSPESILQTDDPELLRLREHEATFGTFERRVVLVVPTQDAFAPGMLEKLTAATERIAALPITREARSLPRSGFPLPEPGTPAFREAALGNRLLCPFLVAEDGRTTAIHAELLDEADHPDRREASLDSIVAAAEASGIHPLVAGIPAVRRAYARHIRNDLLRLPPTVAPVLFLLLLLSIRRLLPVVGLLSCVGLAAIWTVGVLALTGGRVTALTAILPSLILVVGVATCVHVVAQFREETFRGAGPTEAARSAVARMALPCGLTALTTAVGFSSLVIAGIEDVRQFGLYSAVGALMAFGLGVPLVGILLSVTDARASRAPTPLPFGGALDALARTIVRRPAVGILAGLVPAGLSLVGIAHLKSDTFLLEDLRAGEPIHEAVRVLDRELGGAIGFDLVVRSDHDLLEPETFRWLERVEREIRATPDVVSTVGPATLIGEAARTLGREEDAARAAPLLLAGLNLRGGGRVARLFLSEDRRSARIGVQPGDIGSVRAVAVRDAVAAIASRDRPDGVETHEAGLVLFAETVLTRLVREMGKSLAIALAVIFLLMSALFRSLRVGAISMVPNFLPLLVAAGYMGLMGITIRSSIALIFAVALGIAVDDTIHVLTRYLRERRAGRTNDEAVTAAIRWTGRPVMLTSAVLFAGFLAFLTSSFRATGEFGSISAVTIAAAIVGDLLLLPAMLKLWPPRVAASEETP